MHVLLTAALLSLAAAQADTTYLYRTHFVRAAPGKLLELIDAHLDRMSVFEAAGEPTPVILRHAQGDHWDLQIMYPMGSFVDYYRPDRVARREQAANASGTSETAFRQQLDPLVAWREDLYVLGPPVETMHQIVSGGGYFHTEIFIALPGKRDELFREREMENEYQRLTGRPERMIFTRVCGAPWDSFTLGIFRDLQHFAARVPMSADEQDAAAREAGFESSQMVSVYMRSLIMKHQDTHGGIVRQR